MDDQEVIDHLKKLMGYEGGNAVCDNCFYFRSCDESGNINAKRAHCAINPAIDIPVEKSGRCKHIRLKLTTE